MKHFIRIKNKLLNANILAIIIGFLATFFFYTYKLNKYNITDNELYFTKIWLEMGLLFTYITVSYIFIILFIYLIIAAFSKNVDLSENLTKLEKVKVIIGLIIGFISIIALTIILFLCLQNETEFSDLQWISLIFAFIALIIDWLFNCKSGTLKFDTILLFSLGTTFLLSYLFTQKFIITFDNAKHFVYGYTAGATAFQIFIAGLFFNPNEYSKNSIFKSTNKKD